MAWNERTVTAGSDSFTAEGKMFVYATSEDMSIQSLVTLADPKTKGEVFKARLENNEYVEVTPQP